MKSRGRALQIVLLVIGVALLAYFLLIKQYVSLSGLQEKAALFRVFVENHYFWALALYSLVFMLLVVVGAPAVGPLTMLGGSLFGFLSTILSSVVAIACGVGLSFLLIRYVLNKTITERFVGQRERFTQKIDCYGATYIVTLNLLMVVPFFLINTLAALSSLPLLEFLGATMIGTFPTVVIFAFAGKKFAEMKSMRDVFSPSIIGVIAILIIISILPIMIKKMQTPDDLPEED